ncbi:hypothetical protein SAMN05421825_2525 [Epilithonimonas hungarica]|uniref:Uncharacterized protein n=1 Tax=Epilithonimonas hungarica TaxID=454006 RepID=A0A1G7R1Q3_9FLAO|nr:hypothetical protein [Epilithonimonas hungarica]SDG04667.1 hypothetical protein SAMN05421825_2525 [Epilithonimonas hungarica]
MEDQNVQETEILASISNPLWTYYILWNYIQNF